MGSNKLDTGGNESLFTPLLQENDFSLPFWQNAAADTTGIFPNDCSAIADPTLFTYTPLQITPPWKQMHVPYQPNTHDIPETCGNLMVDLNQLHNFQKPMIDPNSLTVGANIPCMYGRDLQNPEGNVKGASRMHDVMNGSVHFNSSQDPGINKRIPLVRSNIGRGYEMTRQGGQADISNISGPQIQNFVGSGGSSIYTTPNSDGPLINNFVGSGVGRTYNTQNSEAIGIGNNGELCIRRFGCPTKDDGSFLSLAIGNNTGVKAKSDHGGAITGVGLYGAVAPQLNTSRARHDSGSSFDLGCNSIGGLSSFQNNVGGFTGLGDHVGGWTSSYNNVGVRGGISTTTNSSLFRDVQKPQANMQHGFPSSTRDLGIVGDKNARYPSLDSYKGFIGPCSSTSTKLLDSGQTAASGLASKSAKLSWSARSNCDQLQKHLENTVQNLSPESSRASSFIRFKESFTRQEHSGQLFPASKDSSAQAVDGNAPPHRNVQPAGLFSVNDTAARCGAGGGVFPKRVGIQFSKDSAAQAAGSGLFPRRLGVQINEYRAAPVAGDGLFQRSRGIKGSKSHVAYAAKCAQYAKEIEVQTATKGQAFPTSNGSGLSQASNVLGVPLPSLKRRAMHPPPAAPRVQRRKIILPPPIHPYMPFSQTAPAPLPHIQWKGLDGLPQPTGQKCMLCKRDLSFTPEGPVQQPAVPPAVAVLPCGHTFHDHCLQTITPEDQSKDPPCIPCAIGET